MSDRRREPRVHEEAAITVKVQSAPQARNLEGKMLQANLTDVSLGGIQMRVDTEIPIGSLLELEVVFHDSPRKYKHMGNVVWKIFKTYDGVKQKAWHNIGIAFMPLANPQLDTWILKVANLLERYEIGDRA